VGIGTGSERLGNGGGVAGRVGRTGVGNAGGNVTGTAGRGGALRTGNGTAVAGDSTGGAPVRSAPNPGEPPAGLVSPPTTSGSEPLAGLAVGARSELFAGDAVGAGPRWNVATVAPPSSAPAIAIAIAIATRRGHAIRADSGAIRTGDDTSGARGVSFDRMTSATASARLDAPSRSKALARCQFTVLSEIPRATAISLLVRPSATRSRISRCLGVS
jgi:hypothetical protein